VLEKKRSTRFWSPTPSVTALCCTAPAESTRSSRQARVLREVTRQAVYDHLVRTGDRQAQTEPILISHRPGQRGEVVELVHAVGGRVVAEVAVVGFGSNVPDVGAERSGDEERHGGGGGREARDGVAHWTLLAGGTVPGCR
jgi:hypothetical protein